MKTFLKTSALVLGLVAVSLPAFSAATDSSAPATKHPRLRALIQRRAAMRKHAAKALGLSGDQIAQLKAKRAGTVAALKSIRADASLTPEQKRAQARATLQAARGDLRSVLTPEQQAKLDAFRAAHAKKRA